MLEEFVKAAVNKIISQNYSYLKLPAILLATIDSTTLLDDWYEYTLTVIDRFGSIDSDFPKLPGIRSRKHYSIGATVAIALAYGDSPVIIGEVSL